MSIKALNLPERIQAARAGDITIPRSRHELVDARRIVAYWEKAYGKNHRGPLQRHLRALGISRDELLQLIAAKPQGTAAFESARWACVLSEALQCDSQRAVPGVPGAGLTAASMPFLRWADQRMSQFLSSLGPEAGNLDIDESLVRAQFAADLAQQLERASARTLVLKMHVTKLSGALAGSTAQQRFSAFVDTQLTNDRLIALLVEEFPVLGRVMATTAFQTLDAWKSALARLVRDWASIGATFGHAPGADRLVGVDAGLADTHRGEKVLLMDFASGFQIIYKPRDQACNRHFQELVTWFADKGFEPAARTLEVLPRGPYGWVEFVPHRACLNARQVDDFFVRHGLLLFIAYLLDGTDFHRENLVADGGQPVLVDIETFFQNVPRGVNRMHSSADDTSPYSEIVNRTALLPVFIEGPVGRVDVSGIASVNGQRTPFLGPTWDGYGTDDMRVARGRGVLPEAHNLPEFKGRSVRPNAHVEDLISGFQQAYEIAVRHRSELMSEAGPVRAFANDDVRYMTRGTSRYTALLRDSTHPDCLRDAVERDFLFDSLWTDTRAVACLLELVPSEQADLWNGDVPIFTSKVGQAHGYDSRGRRFDNFFASSGMTRVLSRLKRLAPGDLELQKYCIRTTLASTASSRRKELSEARMFDEELGPATPEALLEAAAEIGDRLIELRVSDAQEANWAGVVERASDRFVFAPLGYSLYSGAAGIAMFLAFLGEQTGDRRYERVARRAFVGVRRELAERAATSEIGAFSGTSSMLYAAFHLARLWGDSSLLHRCLRVLPALHAQVAEDKKLDVVNGAAGCIPVLLLLHRHGLSDQALDVARCAGDHLLAHSIRTPQGTGWGRPARGKLPLLGFAHGAAGIAWTLLELAAETGDQRYWDAAHSAVAFGRAHWDPRLGYWADPGDSARSQDGARQRLTPRSAWCHGAPGIGIARILSTGCGGDDAMPGEIDAALRSTAALGFSKSHCLCHGDLGNIELFHLAAERLNRPALRDQALRLVHGVLVDARREGRWRCGGPPAVEMPGLMMGLAGIGYGLLRAGWPDRHPSILALSDVGSVSRSAPHAHNPPQVSA